MLARFFADVKCDRAQAVKASLLSNSALATSVHPLNGQTTLQVAVQSAGESVIRALRRHGARWTDTDPQGNNAVHYVAQVARVDLCRYRKSADWVMALHAPNSAGDTPLHTSMALPDIPEVTEIIQAFVAVGADISRPNSDGQSALDLAEDRPELYQLMQDTAHACRTKPSAMAQPDSMSQMGGGASLIGGGPSVLGSGPSSLGGGHGSFIGGPGIHAYQSFPAQRGGPQSSEPVYGPPLSPLRSGSGVGVDSRMSTDGVSPGRQANVAFGRSARPRSTSTPGVAHRSPHAGRRTTRDGGATPPAASRSPQRRSRTPVSRYSPPTSLRAIRTSAEAPVTHVQPPPSPVDDAVAAATAAAQRTRRASAAGAARTDRPDASIAPRSPPGATPPSHRGAVSAEPAAEPKPREVAAVNLAPLEKKVTDVQSALRYAKSALVEIQTAREGDQKQMSSFSKSIALVSERLDGIDSAVRTVASATAEAAEAAAAGRKEGVGEMRELKGHVESLWKDVSGAKEWQRDADADIKGLRAQLRQVSEAAESAEATAEAARTAAVDAADVADAAAADVAQLRADAADAAAAAPVARSASVAAEADTRAAEADAAAEAAALAAEAATADAAAKAADAAAAMGAADAVAAVTHEVEALRASVAEVQAFRGPCFDTVRDDLEELRDFQATAKLKFVELDDALERLEEAAGGDGVRHAAARSLESSPEHWGGSAVPEEVVDRLDAVCRKVGAIESQVAGWNKAHGGDGEGGHGGSGTSASPPRTPEAHSSYPEDTSMDITSDLMVGPPAAPQRSISQREVTASKAGIYTNIYSGPTASLEFSMLAERLESMGAAVEASTKAVKALRADVDGIKARARSGAALSDGAQGSFGPQGSFAHNTWGSDDNERSGLGDMREQQIRSEAGRYEADEAITDLEERMERLDHAVKLVQHTTAQHEDRIAGLMYSPGQARPTDAASVALKNTVEQLEGRLVNIEVQYAGRLQAQKAKVDQQSALVAALMERVAALEARCP